MSQPLRGARIARRQSPLRNVHRARDRAPRVAAWTRPPHATALGMTLDSTLPTPPRPSEPTAATPLTRPVPRSPVAVVQRQIRRAPAGATIDLPQCLNPEARAGDSVPAVLVICSRLADTSWYANGHVPTTTIARPRTRRLSRCRVPPGPTIPRRFRPATDRRVAPVRAGNRRRVIAIPPTRQPPRPPSVRVPAR